MAFGVICACCGEKGERLEVTDASPAADPSSAVYMCQPCKEEPKVGLPDMTVHTIPTETTEHTEATSSLQILTSCVTK